MTIWCLKISLTSVSYSPIKQRQATYQVLPETGYSSALEWPYVAAAHFAAYV